MCTFLKPKSSKEWPPLLHRLHLYYLRLSCKTPRKPFKSRLPKLGFQLPRRLCAVVAQVSTAEPSSEAARRLYVGNIPRNATTDELRKIVEEHGAVEKAEVMYDEYSGRSRRFAFVTMNRPRMQMLLLKRFTRQFSRDRRFGLIKHSIARG